MNSQYFKLPFADVGGLIGLAVTVWALIWLGRKLPVVKGFVGGA